MASDETMMTIQPSSSSSMHEDDQDTYEEDEDQHHSHHNLSRLSMCSSSKHSMNDFDDVASGGDMMMMYMSSGLSIDLQSSYGDEGEGEEEEEEEEEEEIGSSSCLSLPGTPVVVQVHQQYYYFSENETTGGGGNKTKRNSRRKAIRERWLDSEWEKKKKYRDELGEIKACRDLGFELENLKILEIPNPNSCSTSSGGNSPIGSWKISSPGDDPKDVKARLKVWAQAVAASASRLVG